MVSRQSYFMLFKNDLEDHFKEYLSSLENINIWFEYKNEPIEWHQPIGVIYDKLFYDNEELPWEIIVHFTGFPENKLINYTKEEVQWNFINTLKQVFFFL
jgi:autophagy-related protein 5